jgi:Lon protease-like protein
MVRDAMAGDRLIGMVQPRGDSDPPPLFDVGGVGRITQFAETGDGRLMIALTGLTRFRIARELAVDTPYRQVEADYGPYGRDWHPPEPLPHSVRAGLEEALKLYLEAEGLSADWDAISAADDEGLINTLSAVCPFEPVEKQALVETVDLLSRAHTLTTLMAFAHGADAGTGLLN